MLAELINDPYWNIAQGAGLGTIGCLVISNAAFRGSSSRLKP